MAAIVRQPAASLVDCELTHLEAQPIDIAQARAEHAAYVALLERLGERVTVLPALEAFPDSCFVEDVLLALPELFILTRPGALSRRDEPQHISSALPGDRPVAALEAPTTLDGGDVLRIGRDIYVGITTRTNADAVDALGRLVSPFGYRMTGIEIDAALHLKTAITALPDGRLLHNPRWVDAARFGDRAAIEAHPDEAFAGNSLLVGDTVILHAGHARTAALLRAQGYAVETTDISEFAKAEAGLTCLSVVF